MEINKEILDEYGLPTLEQYKENMLEGETEMFYYLQFLNNTDHIPLKIFESFIENMATASVLEMPNVIINFFKDIKVTYNEVLTARKIARKEIAKLESE